MAQFYQTTTAVLVVVYFYLGLIMLKLSKQQEFIFSEITILSQAASVQRANLYNSTVKAEDRNSSEFRIAILDFIKKELLPHYQTSCSEEQHIENIQSLVNFGSENGKEILGKLGYKFGVAQKLLNLFLKYLWCLGHIAESPHCPVDRLILEKTALRGKLNWTEITSASEYQKAIRTVAEKSDLTLAEWELQSYARR